MKSLCKKLKRPLVIFDLETTDANSQTAEIVQFAAIRLTPKNQTKELEFLCRPSISISNGAAEVHGITNEMVADKDPFKEYAKNIEEFFKDADVAGYNLKRFDVKVLERQMEKEGHPKFFENRSVYDAYHIYVNHAPRKLANALKFYTGEEIENAHDALGDVKTTLKVINRQLEIEESDFDVVIEKFTKVASDVPELDRYLKKDGDDYILMFSKNKGQKLSECDKGFLRWIMGKEFPECLKKVVKGYIK